MLGNHLGLCIRCCEAVPSLIGSVEPLGRNSVKAPQRGMTLFRRPLLKMSSLLEGFLGFFPCLWVSARPGREGAVTSVQRALQKESQKLPSTLQALVPHVTPGTDESLDSHYHGSGLRIVTVKCTPNPC